MSQTQSFETMSRQGRRTFIAKLFASAGLVGSALKTAEAAEKAAVAGLHLGVHLLVSLQGEVHALNVCALLVASAPMVDAPKLVRTSQQLQAAVVLGARVDCEVGGEQVRGEKKILVPVAVVLCETKRCRYMRAQKRESQ